MLVHVSGLSAFVDALEVVLADAGLKTTPYARRATVVVRGHLGSPGVGTTLDDLDDQPRFDVVLGEIDGRQHARLGPLSVPGATACPGCVAAHERERLAVRPLGTVAEPDPILLWIAAALTVQEVMVASAALDSSEVPEPITWSAALLVGTSGVPQVLPMLRHVHCGCTWADFLQA